jgi:predicted DNA-binding antitoxin AbrB/MazE fold protein
MKVIEMTNYTIRISKSQKEKLVKYSKKSKLTVANFIENLLDNDIALNKIKLKDGVNTDVLLKSVYQDLKNITDKLGPLC